jgi:ParB/RepB/Spo0J family partition protein
MAPATAAAAKSVFQKYPAIEIDAIESSGLNPRTHWDDDGELVESIRANGVIEPIILRPHPDHDDRFQIVAGERRFRAATVVGLGQIPAIIRDDVTDEKLLELALQENIQRRSMHPLDEANGFIQRLEMGGSSPEGLARALGLSPRYVTDRIRLKKLSAKAAKVLETGDMTVSHAIVLAKLDPKTQDDALQACRDFRFDFEAGKNRDFMAPVSELKEWIAENVRLDITSADVQAEFPEVAEEVAAAAAKGATVVMLSEERTPYHHKAKATDPLFADKWERCKKTDKAAQTGIIVEGHHRGERVYFKPPTPSKRDRASSPSGSGYKQSPAEKLKADARAKRERAAEAKRKDEALAWKSAKADAKAAIAAHVDNLPVSKIVSVVAHMRWEPNVKKATTPEQFVRALALNEALLGDYSVDGMHSHAKAFGFDVKKWFTARLKNNAVVHKLHAPAPAKKAKKR